MISIFHPIDLYLLFIPLCLVPSLTMSLNLINALLIMVQDHEFLILAIGAMVLGLFLRARSATSFPRELPLVREKPRTNTSA